MPDLMYIVYYLVFPGFLFTAVVGLLTTWVDRKVSARVQWRVGPPWYQPFADTVKLLGKEVIVPAGAKRTGFLLWPVVGLAAARPKGYSNILVNKLGKRYMNDQGGTRSHGLGTRNLDFNAAAMDWSSVPCWSIFDETSLKAGCALSTPSSPRRRTHWLWWCRCIVGRPAR